MILDNYKILNTSAQLAKLPSDKTYKPLTGNLWPSSFFIKSPVLGFQILIVLSALNIYE